MPIQSVKFNLFQQNSAEKEKAEDETKIEEEEERLKKKNKNLVCKYILYLYLKFTHRNMT